MRSTRILAFLGLALGLTNGGCHRERARPNVILISLDCLNERQFAHAMEGEHAPHLKRLAGESLVFSNAHAHAPWTTPSHMSMLSGLYPSQHGRDVPYGLMMRDHNDDRIPSYETLPERLTRSGYESMAFVGVGPISSAFGLGKGFSKYHESVRQNKESSDLPETLAEIKAWLGRRPHGPFFLFAHTYELHPPLAPGRSPFRRAMTYVDDHLGQLFSTLRERGLYDSSLIILTGDHGSGMIHTEHKCAVHGAGHYEENLRVPLVIKLPAARATGRHDVLVRHIDLLPTVLDVLGMPPRPYEGPGTSILKRLSGGKDRDRTVTYSEADGRCRLRRAVFDGRYKYIYTPDTPMERLLLEAPVFFDYLCKVTPACANVAREELYDVSADPTEASNLMAGPLTPEQASALERLRQLLTEHLNLRPAYRLSVGVRNKAPEHELDDASREALKALGYIQ